MKTETKLSELFFQFFKIGLFTFGGGYVMISIIEKLCVETKKWITHDEMMNLTVIAEATPGPIAINCATFVGFKRRGFMGALVSTLGMVLPSFLIIFAISAFLDHFLEIGIIANAFRGIKLAVGVLIFDAAVNMIRKMKKGILPMILMIVSVIVMMAVDIFSLRISSIVVMLAAAAVSVSVYAAGRISGNGGGPQK